MSGNRISSRFDIEHFYRWQYRLNFSIQYRIATHMPPFFSDIREYPKARRFGYYFFRKNLSGIDAKRSAVVEWETYGMLASSDFLQLCEFCH